MHRRARHLNARHAGAGLVFDARRITGLADGNSITTWNDSSGNGWDAGQSNSALKPLYKVDVQGGQPGVLFDGTNDIMTITAGGALAYSQNKGYLSIFGVARDTNPSNASTPHGIIAFTGGTGNTRAGLFARLTSVAGVQSGVRRLDADSLVSSASAGVTTSFFVGRSESRFANGTTRASRNGVQTATAALSGSSNTSNTASTVINVGQLLVGHICCAFVIAADIPAPLVKRLEHSLAFSFKLQSS